MTLIDISDFVVLKATNLIAKPGIILSQLYMIYSWVSKILYPILHTHNFLFKRLLIISYLKTMVINLIIFLIKSILKVFNKAFKLNRDYMEQNEIWHREESKH